MPSRGRPGGRARPLLDQAPGPRRPRRSPGPRRRRHVGSCRGASGCAWPWLTLLSRTFGRSTTHPVLTLRVRPQIKLSHYLVILALSWSLIELSYTGSASLRTYRHERVRRYSADSALQAAIQMVKGDPSLGVSGSSSSCGMTYAVQQDTAGGAALQVFDENSVLKVSCVPTPGVTNSGIREPDERGGPTGGQLARDVTFTVTCEEVASSKPFKLACRSGGSSRTLATARVRFDIDYGVVPTRPNCGPYSPNVDPPINPMDPIQNPCTASSVRAVVPKIVYWSLKGG